MICNICNKQIKDLLIKKPGFVGSSVNRDCVSHLYLTFHNDKLIDYVAYWKSPENIAYRIQSDIKTDIFSINKKYIFSAVEEIDAHLFSSDVFFEMPIIDDTIRPDLLIPRLLKLKAFA